MDSKVDSHLILQPPWSAIARAFWLICALLAITLYFASLVTSFNQPLPVCGTAEFTCGPWTMTQDDAAIAQAIGLPGISVPLAYFLTSLFAKIIFIVVGLVIFIRRSDDWIALILSLMLVLFALEGVYNLRSFMPVVNALYLVATLAFLILPFIFPSGRFVPGWAKWLVIPFLVIGSFVSLIPQLGLPISENAYSVVMMIVFGSWFVLAGYATVYRFRRVSDPIERQQTKWVVAGILGTFLGFIPMAIVTTWYPATQPSIPRLYFMFLVYLPVYVLSYLCIPAGIAFAIFRYRLWNIDVIIRKTLIYAVLSTILAVIFFGVVFMASSLLSSVTRQQSSLSLVISTLFVAGMFNPIRHRVQNGIDRRFYRKKYNAEQVLAEFSLITRNETDLQVLTGELSKVVDETLQPDQVNIWLFKK
jgi:hypothetical protein